MNLILNFENQTGVMRNSFNLFKSQKLSCAFYTNSSTFCIMALLSVSRKYRAFFKHDFQKIAYHNFSLF